MPYPTAPGNLSLTIQRHAGYAKIDCRRLRESGRDGLVEKRKFLGIHCECCNVYSRAYVNKEGTKYEGGCPRCGKRVEVKIGSGGTDTRFFNAR